MTVKFQVEELRHVFAEALPLLKEHWSEIALDQETVPLDPDLAAYEAIEDAGRYQITTARDDGILVGYAAYFIAQNLHYKSLMVGESDIFWIAPSHRKGMTGVKLFREAERNLKLVGVNKVVNKEKLHFDLSALFDRLEYTAIERHWSKAI